MALSTNAPQQHKQSSRKSKRAWRKNVDVSEIQAGLENAREEIIKGGIIAEKPSDALFTLDTTGSETIQKSYNKVHKPLKVDEILAKRSVIPAVQVRKRSGVTDGVIEPSNKRRKTNGVSPKEYARLKQRAFGGESVTKEIVSTDDVPSHDPWAEVVAGNHDPRFSYLEAPKPFRAPSTLKEVPISLLASTKIIPAVLKPKAGTSYNPAVDDWEELLALEGQKEVEAEKERRIEAAKEAETQRRIEIAQIEAENYVTEDESAWEGFESEYENSEWLTKRRPERKTPTERNKAKRRKEAERQAKWDAQTKKRDQQAKQIQGIAKGIAISEKKRALARKKAEIYSDEEVDDRALRRRSLGKSKIPEPPLELVLPDELRDSLRLLKPEGNLLKERFRNILIRGKIEMRKPIQQPKKKRRTFTEKWTYKDFTIST